MDIFSGSENLPRHVSQILDSNFKEMEKSQIELCKIVWFKKYNWFIYLSGKNSLIIIS